MCEQEGVGEEGRGTLEGGRERGMTGLARGTVKLLAFFLSLIPLEGPARWNSRGGFVGESDGRREGGFGVFEESRASG